MAAADVPTLQGRFAEFAATYPDLPLYAGICRGVAADAECAALLQAAAPGQDRPVLWLAALHELVLRDPSLPAARWYPSVPGGKRPPGGDPWPEVRATVLEHASTLRETIATRTTQTNEVNRCVYLAPGVAMAAADVAQRPVVLVEMGTSAGLLLHLDRYRVELTGPRGSAVLGDPSSAVRCEGVDRSPVPYACRPGPPPPPVVGRAGVDLHPVDLRDAERVRWLEACLWPDVPGRVERFRAAVALAAAQPTPVVRGDMVDDLPAAVAAASAVAATTAADAHVVVFSSWALTYVDSSRRPQVLDVLRALARSGSPVSWLTAEPPGCGPGIPAPAGGEAARGQLTVLGLRRWRDGRELPPTGIGACHPHGEWLSLR